MKPERSSSISDALGITGLRKEVEAGPPLPEQEITGILREYRESTGSPSRWVRVNLKGGVGHRILIEIGNIVAGKTRI